MSAGLLGRIRLYHLSPFGWVRILCHLAAGRRLCRRHGARLRDYVPACLNSMTTAWNYAQLGLSPARTLVDVGANASQMIRLLQIGAPAERILSFEPNPDCQPLGEVHRVALGDVDGTCTLYVARDDYGSMVGTRRADCVRELTVATRRFDSLGIDLGACPKPILVKVDAEGYELKALRGFGDQLRQVDRLLVEVQNDRAHGCPYDATELYAFVREQGFTQSQALFGWFHGSRPPEYFDVWFARPPGA